MCLNVLKGGEYKHIKYHKLSQKILLNYECFRKYSKAVKQSLEDANTAFMRFFKKHSAFPRYKKRIVDEPKMYFVKNNKKDRLCERHRIKVPSLGWVQFPLTKNLFRTLY